MSDAPSADKAALRARMKAARRALTPEARSRAALALCEHLVDAACWRQARVVALYASLPAELDTRPLLEAARARGLRVALPVVEAPGAPLCFREAGHGVRPGPFGVAEPVADAPEVPHAALEVVVVPALALDVAGRRLGYGGGYYDRTLPLCAGALHIGVVYGFQVVERVPTGPDDVALHGVLTPEGWVRPLP